MLNFGLNRLIQPQTDVTHGRKGEVAILPGKFLSRLRLSIGVLPVGQVAFRMFMISVEVS